MTALSNSTKKSSVLRLNEKLLTKTKWREFPIKVNAAGISDASAKGETYIPSKNGSLVYFNTTNIDAASTTIKTNGGKTLYPKTAIGGEPARVDKPAFKGADDFARCRFDQTRANRLSLRNNVKVKNPFAVRRKLLHTQCKRRNIKFHRLAALKSNFITSTAFPVGRIIQVINLVVETEAKILTLIKFRQLFRIAPVNVHSPNLICAVAVREKNDKASATCRRRKIVKCSGVNRQQKRFCAVFVHRPDFKCAADCRDIDDSAVFHKQRRLCFAAPMVTSRRFSMSD